jgi:hypothetical protein
MPERYKGILCMKKIEAELKVRSPIIKKNELDGELLLKLEQVYKNDARILEEMGFTSY